MLRAAPPKGGMDPHCESLPPLSLKTGPNDAATASTPSSTQLLPHLSRAPPSTGCLQGAEALLQVCSATPLAQ